MDGELLVMMVTCSLDTYMGYWMGWMVISWHTLSNAADIWPWFSCHINSSKYELNISMYPFHALKLDIYSFQYDSIVSVCAPVAKLVLYSGVKQMVVVEHDYMPPAHHSGWQWPGCICCYIIGSSVIVSRHVSIAVHPSSGIWLMCTSPMTHFWLVEDHPRWFWRYER